MRQEVRKLAQVPVVPAALLLVAFGVDISVCEASTNCVPAPSGLVSCWKGENNTLDQFGGNNGTIAGNPMTYVAGEVGEAFDFLGDTEVDVGIATNLQLQDFTIEGWVREPAIDLRSGTGTIFGFGEDGYQFGMYQEGSFYLAINQEDDYNGPQNEIESTGQITDTNFHHFAVTKSGTNVYFFIDGVSELAPPFAGTFEFSTDAGIGATGDGYNPFVGTIDELSVYNRPLVPVEIQAIYHAGNAGKCLNLGAPYIF